MPLQHIDTAHPAIKTGYAAYGDEVCRKFAIFDADVALKMAEAGCEDLAVALTGWFPYQRGPGRPFAEEPFAKLFGKKVLVIQRVGWDV